MNRADLGQVIDCLRQVEAGERGSAKQDSDPMPCRSNSDPEQQNEVPPGEASGDQKGVVPPAKPANIGGIIQPY